MNKREAARMKRLANFLEKLDEGKLYLDRNRFDLRVWSEDYHAFACGANARGWRVKGPRSTCGTVACAVGHIPLAMPRSGFQITESSAIYRSRPVYKTWTNWEAVTRFFGINLTEATYLFEHTNYTDPNDIAAVVARLRAFVTAKGYQP